jgi:integrase
LCAFFGLQAVEGLRAGRSEARESEPVKPVNEDAVAAVLPLVSPQVAAMIQLQQITGMRPGEVTIMRGIDIEKGAQVWVYRPMFHKTQHHGHIREVYLGPRAQAIITPFFKPDVNAYLFSPADAVTNRRQKMRANRKTPLSCGNSPGTNVIRRPAKKKPTSRYHTTSYTRAVRYACERLYPLPAHLNRQRLLGKLETPKAWRARLTPEQLAEVKRWRKEHTWHPNQLRHSSATNLRKRFGLEPAQVILGQKSLQVTQVYAEVDKGTAIRVMAEVG